MRTLIILIIALLALTLFVSGAGCQKAETSELGQLDSEMSNYDEASEAIGDLVLDFNETELEELEGMF